MVLSTDLLGLDLTELFSSESCVFPCAVGWIDADRAQKHGMDEFISANPCSFDHASLFEMVQRLTLDHRLNDTFCCLVRFSYVSRMFDLVIYGCTHSPRCVLSPPPCRDGSAQDRCLSWTSTVPGTGFEAVTDICVTCAICWKEGRVGQSLTPPCFTTASLSVPPTSMGTGVPPPSPHPPPLTYLL